MPKRDFASRRSDQWEPPHLLVLERQLTGAVLQRVYAVNEQQHRPLATEGAQFVVDLTERTQSTAPRNATLQSQTIFSPDQLQKIPKRTRNKNPNQSKHSRALVAGVKEENNRVIIPEGTLHPEKEYTVGIRRIKPKKFDGTLINRRVGDRHATSMSNEKLLAEVEAESVAASCEILLPKYVPKLPPR
jgi:hypothetical protein